MSIECGTYKPTVNFSCTGSDESHVWKKLHGEVLDSFHCGTCQKHAQKIFNGIHSMVSLGIGKGLPKQEYKDSLIELQMDINNVVADAKKDGRL